MKAIDEINDLCGGPIITWEASQMVQVEACHFRASIEHQAPCVVILQHRFVREGETESESHAGIHIPHHKLRDLIAGLEKYAAALKEFTHES